MLRNHFGLLPLLFVVTLASTGCSPPSKQPPLSGFPSKDPEKLLLEEKSIVEQCEAVRNGLTKRILVEKATVSDEDLRIIAECGGLNELLLDAGVVDDDQLILFLPKLSLSHLRLRNSPITDVGLRKIAETQKSLRILNLPQATLTAEGLKALAHLEELNFLRISGATIDDRAVEVISMIPNLESLHLISPTITAASFKSIAKMPKLRSFYVDDCFIPDEDWLELLGTTSNLHVHIDQAHHDRDPRKH